MYREREGGKQGERERGGGREEHRERIEEQKSQQRKRLGPLR